MDIEVGQLAPTFETNNQNGEAISLSDQTGKWVVLYFYPKDDTPGCTVEACSFRDDHSKLEAEGAVVLGVSPDGEASHLKFANKFNLPFPLLADTDHAIAEAYGAWGEKSMYGRTYMGVFRSTFLIDPDGRVAHVWPKVKPEGHSQEVLSVLVALRNGEPVPVEGEAAKPGRAPSTAKAKSPAKKPGTKTLGTPKKTAAKKAKVAAGKTPKAAKKGAAKKVARKVAKRRN
jgi:peroxiredoxin Q/BCP